MTISPTSGDILIGISVVMNTISVNFAHSSYRDRKASKTIIVYTNTIYCM